MTIREIDAIDRLRQACTEAGSARAWAAAHGYSAPYVSRVLAGIKRPSRRLLRDLGIRTAVVEDTHDT